MIPAECLAFLGSGVLGRGTPRPVTLEGEILTTGSRGRGPAVSPVAFASIPRAARRGSSDPDARPPVCLGSESLTKFQSWTSLRGRKQRKEFPAPPRLLHFCIRSLRSCRPRPSTSAAVWGPGTPRWPSPLTLGTSELVSRRRPVPGGGSGEFGGLPCTASPRAGPPRLHRLRPP